MILLDTNVLSELMRPRPSPVVESWLGNRPADSLFFSAVGEAELRFGLALMPAGRRERTRLQPRSRPCCATTLRTGCCHSTGTRRERMRQLRPVAGSGGRPIAEADCQIAAIARARGMALATRNSRDFAGTGIDVLDPWTSP